MARLPRTKPAAAASRTAVGADAGTRRPIVKGKAGLLRDDCLCACLHVDGKDEELDVQDVEVDETRFK